MKKRVKNKRKQSILSGFYYYCQYHNLLKYVNIEEITETLLDRVPSESE